MSAAIRDLLENKKKLRATKTRAVEEEEKKRKKASKISKRIAIEF